MSFTTTLLTGLTKLTNRLTLTNRQTVPIPMTPKSYYTPVQAAANRAVVQGIQAQFGPYISQASRLTNVPVSLIESIIFIESAGKPNVVSPAGAVGLMQLTPDTVTTVIHLEKKGKRLTTDEIAILRTYLGTRLDTILKLRYLSDPAAGNTRVTASMYSPPEVNILLGAMMLGQLLDEEKGRLDIVVSRYNAGYFWKPKAASVDQMINLAHARGGAETANYITKLVGKNGLLETLT